MNARPVTTRGPGHSFVLTCGKPRDAAVAIDRSDPVTTEIVRHSLNSAANQMKHTLIRTAFSPIIYEVLDFAVAIYDRNVRLLAQSPGLLIFMGTLNFCVEAAVAAVGGEEALDPGDIIVYNYPFGTGSHPQDCVLVMPVFLGGQELIGYTTIKAHWLDIGGKEPYCTDTVDLYQEGTIYPGVKLFRKGKVVQDIYRTILANTRMPRVLEGDINAQVAGVRVGARELERIVRQYGPEQFRASVERMFDHGEAMVRSYLEQLPDGRYAGSCQLDDNGLDHERIPIELVLEIRGSTARVDYTGAVDAQRGPTNCPLASTVSCTRVALAVPAAGGNALHEGHFRPIEILTRPGSIFHPLPPTPTFLYAWPGRQAMDAIFHALADALPSGMPAGAAGDVCGVMWWGQREGTEEQWTDGTPHPMGHGAHAGRDGGTLMYLSHSCVRFTPIEVWEAKNPWLIEKFELRPDSCGAGRFRGGLGIDVSYRMLEDAYLTCIIERRLLPAYGLDGGECGEPNRAEVRYPDGSRRAIGKVTGLRVPKHSVLDVHIGGGGGFGPAEERSIELIVDDLKDGYVTEEHVRRHYRQYSPTQ